MKRICVLLLLVMIAQPALAVTNRAFLGGGIAAPLAPEEFSDFWNLGFTGHGSVSLAINETAAARFGVDYSRFGVDDGAFGFAVNVDGGAVSAFYVSGGLMVSLNPASGSSSDVYFTAGLGLFHLAIDDVTASDGFTSISASGGDEDALGLHVGTGATFSNFFAELLFVIGLTEGETTTFLPIRIGAALPLGTK